MTRYRIERLDLEHLAALIVVLGAGLAAILGLVLWALKAWVLT